jgi:hypothetical protein
MDFSQNVDKEFVNSILESSLWQKANVEVKKSEVVSEEANEGEIEVVDEYQDGLANEYDEPTTIDDGDTDYSEDSFTLDDLQYVLDNLEDEDLMEHAMNMLDVFDVAYEQLSEDSDEEYEEDVEEDEEDEDADELEENIEKGYGAGAPPHSAAAKKIHKKRMMMRKKKMDAK